MERQRISVEKMVRGAGKSLTAATTIGGPPVHAMIGGFMVKITIYPTRYITDFTYNTIVYRKRGLKMDTKRAVADRIIELCSQKNIAINALANAAGIPPSTVYSALSHKSKNPGIVTIKKLCDGLEISLAEFFDAEAFRSLEQELE